MNDNEWFSLLFSFLLCFPCDIYATPKEHKCYQGKIYQQTTPYLTTNIFEKFWKQTYETAASCLRSKNKIQIIMGIPGDSEVNPN